MSPLNSVGKAHSSREYGAPAPAFGIDDKGEKYSRAIFYFDSLEFCQITTGKKYNMTYN